MEDCGHWDELLERGHGLEDEVGHLETMLRGHVERLTGKQLQSELATFDGQVLSRLGMDEVRV